MPSTPASVLAQLERIQAGMKRIGPWQEGPLEPEQYNFRAESAFGVRDPLEGVAVWSSPNKPVVSASTKDLSSFLPILFSSYVIGARRARPIFRQIEANHKKHAPEPHFYLDNLGVLAAARGKGLSSQLIRPFLQTADEQKAIALPTR